MSYTKLTSAFDNDVEAGSLLHRLHRLIAECIINTDLITKLILKFKGIYIHENIKDVKVLHYGRKAKNLFKCGQE